jgi:SAM-dependent methyltransferase
MIEFWALYKYLNPKSGEKICDLGCGHGVNDPVLALTGARVCGVDIDRTTLDSAKHNARRLRVSIDYCVSDLNRAICIKSQSFDKAVSYCVLEHLDRPEQFLNEVNRILRPGGTLALSADSFSYFDIPKDIMDIHRDICRVKNYYTKKDAEELLHKCNFSVTKCSYRIKSLTSSMLFKGLLRNYFRSELFGQSCCLWFFKLLAPIALFACKIADGFHDDSKGGYWLTLLAVKEG